MIAGTGCDIHNLHFRIRNEILDPLIDFTSVLFCHLLAALLQYVTGRHKDKLILSAFQFFAMHSPASASRPDQS